MNKHLLSAASGMGMLLTGRKLAALGMFTRGVMGLERQWRDKHPDVPYTLDARWQSAIQFYEHSHQHPTNRRLHRIGIPMIVGGAVGLLIARPFRPLWTASAISFTAGWAFNFVGHYYEKSAPAFAEDPLAFLAGPVWDLRQIRKSAPVVAAANSDAAPSLN